MRQARRRMPAALAAFVAGVFLFGPEAFATAFTAMANGAWTNPTIWSPGGTPGAAPGDTVTIPVGVTVSMDYGMPNDLVGFSNAGTLTFVAGANLRLGAGANASTGTINVSAGTLTINATTLTLQSGSVFSISNATITGGTLNCSSCSMTIGDSTTLNGTTINNTGTVAFNSTNMLFMNGGTIFNNNSGGVFDARNNGQLGYSAGAFPTFNNNAGATFKKTTTAGTTSTNGFLTLNNNGMVDAQLGTIQMPVGTSSGTFKATAPQSVDFNSATHSMNGASIDGNGVKINGGNVSGAGGLTVLGGATLTWSSGTMSGAGSTTIAALGTLVITGAVTLETRTIHNNGTTILNNGGLDFQFAQSAVFNNNGVFDDQNTVSGRIVYGYGSGPCNFNNVGTFKKTAGPAAAFSHQNPTLMLFNSNGIVDAQVGTINLSNGTSSGLFTVTGSGFVRFVGPHTMNGATVGGSGGVQLVAGGTIQGPSFIIPSGATFTWNDGTMGGSSTDVTTINAGGTLSIVGTAHLSSRTINNNGTTIVNNGGADFQFHNSAVFNNNGVFDDQNTISWRIVYASGSGPCNFNNAGTFKRTAGPAAAFSNQNPTLMLFNNSGIVHAQVGTINLSNGTSSGLFTVTGSGFVDFVGPHTMNGATVGGSGGVRLVAGGIITGSNFIIPAGATFTWTNGTIGNAAADLTTINSGGTLNITGPATLNAGTISNSGTVIFNNAGADFQFGNGATFNNNATGVFDDRNTVNARLVYAFGAQGSFNNAGTLTKTVGASTFSFQGNLPVTNSGTVQAQTGTMSFGPYTQTAGATISGPGSLSFGSPMNLNGGILKGAGTISGSVVNNSGAVNPGTSAGALTISGNYTQGASGTLNTELQGLTPGTQHDQLNVTGTATLDGILNVTLIGGYTPNNTDFFDVLTFGSRSGDFATKNYPTCGGCSFSSTYGATFLRIVAGVSQANLAVSQSAPSPIAQGQNAVFTITISNNAGGANATNVTVTNTFSGGVFVSATPSQGSCAGTGPVTCSLGTVPLSSSATITLTINGNTVGTISNTATVSASEFDPDNTNNSSTQSVVVSPSAADLSIVKSGPASVLAGSSVTYTIAVTNNGPGTSSSISVSDPTPAGLTFVSNSGACTTAYPCSIASLANGASATITSTYNVSPAASGTINNTATVSAATTDPVPANDSSTTSTTITQVTDLEITKSGPATASSGATITYSVTVKNHGPSTATNVVVSDPTPAGLQFLGNSGACTTAYPCALGVLTSGQSATIQSSYKVIAAGGGSITNTASVSTTTSDSNATNNSASKTTSIGCPTSSPANLSPGAVVTTPQAVTPPVVPVSGALTFATSDSSRYEIYLEKGTNGCTSTSPFASRLDIGAASMRIEYTNLDPGTQYSWRVDGVTPSCPLRKSSCLTFTTAGAPPPPPPDCPASGPVLNTPTLEGDQVRLSWSSVRPGATYTVRGSVGGSTPAVLGTTTETFLVVTLPNGALSWTVEASVPNCPPVTSSAGSFNICIAPLPPVASVVAQSTSGQIYRVLWEPVTGADHYEVEESTDPGFTNIVAVDRNIRQTFYQPQTRNVQSGRLTLHYRVRGVAACGAVGRYSTTVRIIIASPPKGNEPKNANIPAGSTQALVMEVFVAGDPTGNFLFSATVDKPWLSVQPTSGVLPSSGITLQVTANPTDLPNGTFTGTVIVVITPATTGSGSSVVHGAGTVSVPISITMVTPVTPTTKTGSSGDTLIIPSVGHLDGIQSRWQSDIRVTNITLSKAKYQLTFTPQGDQADHASRTTVLDIDSGATTALDDIVRNWYGIGELGDSANGVLEVRPLGSRKGDPAGNAVSISTTTVASSRTYNTSANGTLGQFIPAIPFSSFIGRAGGGVNPVLSMQQIAQNNNYRTNLGVVEAAGQPANVLMSIFNAAGNKLLDLPLDLKANEQKQLNSILALNNIVLADGRVEVRVTGGDGKVTAYASVIDNTTRDPLLVPAVQLGQVTSNRFVLPGVADLNANGASWRTDMRVFNAGSNLQGATLTFYPQNNSGQPSTSSLSIAPGEVKTLDNLLQSTFGLRDTGGAVHVTTPTPSPLVVTGRTYNQTSAGTFGQFIEAVTPNDAASRGGRSLNILQVEDSPRFRTNLGLAEVSGQAATVEVTVILPDVKFAPKVEIPLAANEFRQLSILRDLGLGNVYNARLLINVVGGAGRVTAYGSVIDMVTSDPTYVPAQ